MGDGVHQVKESHIPVEDVGEEVPFKAQVLRVVKQQLSKPGVRALLLRAREKIAFTGSHGSGALPTACLTLSTYGDS